MATHHPTLSIGWYAPTHGDTMAFGDPSKNIPASMEYLAEIAETAEKAGFEYMLVPTGQTCWEAWIAAAYMAARTRRIKMLVALKPGYIHPYTLAKMVASFDQIPDGKRICINLIAGTSPADARSEGQMESKEARYEQMEEEIILLKRLLSETDVEFEGKYYNVHSPKVIPKVQQQPHPPFFLGGGSGFAAQISAKHSHTHLFWGDYPDRIAAQIKELCALAATFGRADELQFAMRLQVICREDEADAWAFARQLVAGAQERRAEMAVRVAKIDSAANDRQRELAAVMDNKLTPHLWTGISDVRTGAGTAVVGNPKQVAAQLMEFVDAGCRGFCLSGYPHREEAEIFGRLVMPLLTKRS